MRMTRVHLWKGWLGALSHTHRTGFHATAAAADTAAAAAGGQLNASQPTSQQRAPMKTTSY